MTKIAEVTHKIKLSDGREQAVTVCIADDEEVDLHKLFPIAAPLFVDWLKAYDEDASLSEAIFHAP